MKPLLKWGLLALVSLAVLGAVFGQGGKSSQTQKAVADTNTASASAASSPEPTAKEASTPEPTPEPKVDLEFTGPSSVRTDDVVLKGTVDPANAHVRIEGRSVEVRHGHWKLPVTLKQHGENTFQIVATRKSFTKAITTAVVTRNLSASEKAAIRRERAERRANARALESAENYLSFEAFSKQGLYKQLSSSAGEGFTEAEAQYAVNHVHVDWNKQAVKAARSYLKTMPMSRSELLAQLSSSAGEGFTYAQALYAVNKVY
jgi:Host cell surface-exposed lipoprotein